MTYPSPKRNMVPKAVLMRSGLVSLTTARPVNIVQLRTTVNSARPMTNVFNKAHSTVRRPINNKTTSKNILNAVKENQVNAVKALDCWVWKLKTKVIDHGNPQMYLQDKGVINSGCSRHMTGNMSYLTDFEEINRGYVAFGGNFKGEKITGRDHLGKFDGKADEGFFVGYSINSKAFRVFNSRTRIVEENLHVQFNKHTPNIIGSGPNWLFDIDALTRSMNYKPVIARNQSNGNVGIQACDDACKARMETVPGKDYILLPLWTADPPFSQSPKSSPDAGFKPSSDDGKKDDEEPRKDNEFNAQEKEDNVNSTNNVNAASTNEVNVVGAKTSIELLIDPDMPALEDIVYSDDDEDVGAEADMNNLDAFMPGLLALKLDSLDKKDERVIVIIKNKSNICRPVHTKEGIDYDEVFAPVARIEAIRLFLAYASFKDFVVYQMDVKSTFLYGKIEKEVYICQPLGFEDPDFPDRVYKVEKALYRLHQAPRAWDKGGILLVQVYVDDIIFCSIKKSLCTEFEKMMHKKFQMSSMGELIFFLGLQVKHKEDGIFTSQDKYVTETLKKFSFTDVKTASTPIETQKALLKDEDGEEVDVHLYRSMIGSLMYLTSSRPDIMFAVCACARYQVNPKVSHLHVVKRIFRHNLLLLSYYCWVTYYCQLKVNAARHKLTTAGER
ncbi:putative ribonuclease H-like domain-containing protein [Tanacetum coccineum]